MGRYKLSDKKHQPGDGLKPSTEELIEIARQGHEDGPVDELNEVEEFILDYPVERDDEARVNAGNIYYRYTQWWNDRHTDYYKRSNKPIYRNFFFRTFKKYFNMKIGYRERVYGVEASKFELSQDEWWAMRRQLNAERKKPKHDGFKKKRGRKKKVKKKSRKKSRT